MSGTVQVPGNTEQLVAKCIALGLTMQQSGRENATTHASVTLQPETMRRDEFDTLCRRQLLWNEAVNNTARNFCFLRQALRETAMSDVKFTGRLVKILQDVYLGALPYQTLMLGVFRTDYMRSGAAADRGDGAASWKNVEINTISCSFAGLSPLVSDFHRHLAAYQRALCGNGNAVGPETAAALTASSIDVARNSHVGGVSETKNNGGVLERSTSAKMVPEALAAAVAAWSKQQNFDTLRAAYETGHQGREGGRLFQPIVLVVVQANERNTGDQFALLFELLEVHGIVSLRRTLEELQTCMTLHVVSNGPPLAVVDEQYPVAVAYFRSTYTPEDFLTETAWTARHDIERSSAIKCPSIPYHLLTFKKLQELFCDVNNVLIPIAFRGNEKKARQLQCHFVSQHSLNPAEVGEEAVQRVIHDALQHPERYVLKPQLEGGGNLLTGESMQAVLRTTKDMDPALFDKVRREYILMSRIDFPVRSGALLVQGKVVQLEKNMCSELGIYGVILSDDMGRMLHNASAGYIVRTKPADVDDGGVMSGVAALDSLALV